MGIDDLLGFDEEKYSQSLHAKYPTIEALQANERKKSEQIAAATGGVAASIGLGFIIGPAVFFGMGFSGRNLSIAKQKRDLIRKALKERYDIEKTSMSGKTFIKNAGLAVAVKGLTLGAAHGVEHFCTAAIPPVIGAANHDFGVTATAIAHPEHYLEGVKDGVMSELHAVHTLATTGSPDVMAQQAAMQTAYGPTGDSTYLSGAIVGDRAAREAGKGVVKLAIKGGSKLVTSRLNKPTPPGSKPTTSESTIKPTVAPTAAKAQEEYIRRRMGRLPSTTQTQEKTQKEFTAAVTTRKPAVQPPTGTQGKLKRRPRPISNGKHNNDIVNWIIAASIFVPIGAISFYAPSLFRIWSTALSLILVNLLVFAGYALVEITKSVIDILSVVGYLLSDIAKIILTIVLPKIISSVVYGLFEIAKAVLEIFNFIGYFTARIVGFVVTGGNI